ncbi:hypothetical protein [Clostridium sp.]|uniref:hypothetical protein n=1 Tax=Clostridium sp. TaxID=1506 RepID=UPI00262DCCB1|nr:hypothetical protein [Clostridium sp.]
MSNKILFEPEKRNNKTISNTTPRGFRNKKLLSKFSKEKMTVRVNKISDVIQTNSATAEETAASTQELASHSQLISDKLSAYKLKIC